MEGADDGNLWQQGSHLGTADIESLLADEPVPDEWDSLDVYIIASHSCDIARPKSIEPSVEILRGVKVDSVDGNLTYGKSSRSLDINSKELGHSFRVASSDRIVASRAHLSTPAGQLSKQDTTQIARWLSRRYTRAAFPDEFNRRIGQKRKRVRSILKLGGTHLSLLLFWLLDSTELRDGSVYQLTVIGTLGVTDYKDSQTREDAIKVLDSVVNQLNQCEGIEITDHEVRSEAGVSLSDLRYLLSWDVDDLSMRDDDAAVGPTR